MHHGVKHLGYPWKRLVKKPNDSQYGGPTVFNVSIPGIDIPWNGLDTLKTGRAIIHIPNRCPKKTLITQKKRLEELQLEAIYTNLDVDSPQKKQKSKAKMGM